MPPNISPKSVGVAEERLTLRSQMSDISLVPGWIERLASQHGIPAATQFAMNLCIEEIVSNAIRHGYSGEPDHSVTFASPHRSPGGLFSSSKIKRRPLTCLPRRNLPAATSLDDAGAGGQGIRLVRRFADAIEYEPLPAGNRLTLAFGGMSSAPED